ncbi:MAG: PAC2 family protein [Actinobacteria bacterium]|nr:PAC2 family protein [Actinomycetota bacterium]
MQRSPVGTFHNSTTTCRSRIGNSPASSKACMRGTSRGRWVRMIRPLLTHSRRKLKLRHSAPRKYSHAYTERTMSDAYRISPNFAGALPTLNDPVLVIMLSGWIDTSNAAATAMEALVSETGATTLIEFDAEFLKSTLDVPAGVEAVLEHALHTRGITAIGLWAQVPHYVASMAYPAASVALIDALCSTSGLAIDVSSLREQSTTQRERLNGLVMANAEHAAMLAKLEEAFDAQHAASDPAATGIGGISLPSGEEIAAELEQFLREHNTDS